MVKYRAEPDLWHERLVLTRIFGHVYLVATPDHDVYPLAMSMPPLLDAVVLEWDRNVDRLGDDRIYRFDAASGVVTAEQFPQRHPVRVEMQTRSRGQCEPRVQRPV